MKSTDAPSVKLVGHAVDADTLESLIRQAVDEPNKPFIAWNLTRGGPQTCGFLYQDSVPGYSSRTHGDDFWSCEMVSQEFFYRIFHEDTLFDPPMPPSPEMVKGWAVERAMICGKLMVVLKTAWV